MSLDAHVVISEVEVDFDEIFVIIDVLPIEEGFHVLDERHGFELICGEAVDVSEEVLVELTLVTRVILGDRYQPLRLLAIELLDVELGRRSRLGRSDWPP